MKTILEAVPPELHRGEEAIEAVMDKVARVHAEWPLDGVNVPEIHEEPARSSKGERRQPFAPRVAPRDLAWMIRERLGIECMINHVVVHEPAARLLDWCRQTWEEYGIRQFVLVGGGRAGVRYPGPSVTEANQRVRDEAAIPGLRIGNICIPSRTDEAARMGDKVAAGADFFTTQILYEADDFTALLDELHEQNAAPAELLLAFCPIRRARNLRFLLWLGVNVPDALEAWLTENEAEVPARSLQQIRNTWDRITAHQHRQERQRPALGVNLAPIGAIPPAVTVGLLGDLAERADAPGEARA